MIELREYQAEGLTSIWNYFQSGKKGNPLIAWPCGTGKSIVPAIFIKSVMSQWPRQRFLMITHISELIKQNHEVLKNIWENAPVSIYSAGLKLKNAAMPIVFGGIQSMIKNPSIFGFRDLIFIDEAHLISQDESSQYLTFIATMKLINPNIKIVGMTATPFRVGQGLITDNGLFTDIVHDITGPESFMRLIAQNYLVPLIPLRTHEELNIEGVGISKGDFISSQLQNSVDKKEITYKILQETAKAGENRRSWLIFSSGIEHAEHIAEILRSFGISSAAVHSQQNKFGRNEQYNEDAIRNWKNGTLRSVVTYGKMTTGVNNPMCDLISDLRPTLSAPLHVQKYGRGTRTFSNKLNCLVLDFARNTQRLGPIDDVAIPRKRGEKAGEIPVKICEACGAYNHTRVTFCCQCGAEFQFRNKLVAQSGADALLRSDLPVVENFDITYITYQKQPGKDGKPPYIRAKYFCGLRSFNQNVFPEHNGYAKKLFKDWWMQRSRIEPPATVDDAMKFMNELRTPKKIKVWVNKKYPEILGVEW